MLTAQPSLVFIDPGSAFGFLTVDYEYSHPVDIWERFDNGPLKRRERRKTKSTFQTALKGGQKYEVAAYDSFFDVDPNKLDNPVEPLDFATARALRKEQSFDLLSEPLKTEVGGTFFALRIATGTTKTSAVLQVGTKRPVTDALGVMEIPDPEWVLQSESQVVHEMEIVPPLDPLLPGNPFFFVARINDENGRWQQFSGDFVTKQRRATIQFTQIYMMDDSDVDDVFPFNWEEDDGDNLRFRFQIHDVGLGQHKVIKDFFHSAGDISDKAPNNVRDIAGFGYLFVDGPRSLTPTSRFLGVSLLGLEEDDFVDDVGETLYGYPVTLKFPAGRDEVVIGQSQKILANPRNGSSLKFEVTAQFSVVYV